MFNALNEFWGDAIPDVNAPDRLEEKGLIIQFGVFPDRMDLLNEIDGGLFEEAWRGKVTETIRVHQEKFPIYFIGLKGLIKINQASNRPRDLEDLKFLIRRLQKNHYE